MKLKPISEAEFTSQVIQYARLHGWLVAHFRPAMTGRTNAAGKKIWVTPVQGDGKGFPDLVLVSSRVIYAELKVGANSLSADQITWEYRLKIAGAEHHVWRPEDWPEIEKALGGVRYAV